MLTIGQVRFIGTTLWADFDALAQPAPGGRPPDMTELLRAREKAYRAANFYLRSTGGTRRGKPLLAEEVRELGLECQQWLKK